MDSDIGLGHQVANPLRPPGQARPNWWIIAQVARRLVDSKRRRAWDFAGPEEILSEIAKVLPGYRGLDAAKLGDAGWQRLRPEAKAKRSLSRVEQAPPRPDPEYPLILVTGRALYDRGTLLQRAERVHNLVPEAYVAIHPTDAERFGVADGDEASLVSAVGRLGLTVKVSTEVTPGVAFAPESLSAAPLSVLFSDRSTLPSVRITK